MKIKKKVLIVEDNEADWRQFKNWIDEKFDVYPKDEESFGLLRELIARTYGKNTLAKISEASRVEVHEQIKSITPALCIIDYQLVIDNNTGNGLRFSQEFLPGRNLLFITGTEGKMLRQTITSIKKFCEQAEAAEKRDFFCKLDPDDDSYRLAFLEKVDEFFGTERDENLEGY